MKNYRVRIAGSFDQEEEVEADNKMDALEIFLNDILSNFDFYVDYDYEVEEETEEEDEEGLELLDEIMHEQKDLGGE